MYKKLIVFLTFFGGAAAHAGPSIFFGPKLEGQIKAAALRHGVNPKLYRTIVALESAGRQTAYNRQTHDYGLAQVNKKTAAAYDFDLVKLKTCPDYNLNAGAKILSDFKNKYERRDGPLWVCRYNVGTGPLKGARLQRCIDYLIKLRHHE